MPTCAHLQTFSAAALARRYLLPSAHCWGKTLKVCLFFFFFFFLVPPPSPGTSREEEEQRGRVALKLLPVLFCDSSFSIRSFAPSFVVLEMRRARCRELCEATLLTSAEKKRKGGGVGWGAKKKKRKRPKDKAALKSDRASAVAAGATARVQAQLCNKEEGWGWGWGC